MRGICAPSLWMTSNDDVGQSECTSGLSDQIALFQAMHTQAVVQLLRAVSHSNHSMRKGRPCVCWEVKGAMWARGKSRSGKSLWDGQRVSTHALSRFVALRAPSAPCRAVLSTLKGLPDVLFQIAHTSNLQVHCCFVRAHCMYIVCVCDDEHPPRPSPRRRVNCSDDHCLWICWS